ncbi:non-ribosomal peptide synthetase [Methylosinus sp. C49]|uniref:non-ribosomal peptide synthetase n=1 Tax=Methylosinus sp. C49 TaxID=2699395 RepID=UPI00137AD48E|nr:non-ribosomal peptide synthetase [Methylosinus sp. C49]
MMTTEDRMLALARRFAQAEPDMRRELLRKMAASAIDFSLLPIPPLSIGDRPALASYAQRRLFFLWRLEPESSAYNLHAALHLEGALDDDALRGACDRLLKRHAALRTTFRYAGEEVYQIVESGEALCVATEDLRALPPETREARAQNLAEIEARRPFDLEQGPLLRVVLLRLGDGDYRLLFTLHHIVCDGWSMDLVIRDFAALYVGLHRTEEPQLASSPIQYADYALWQRNWLEAGGLEPQLQYWTQKLGGDRPPLELPYDRRRPKTQSFRGARHAFDLDAAISADIREAAQRHNATPFMFLLAVFYALLYRVTGEGDVAVGVPIANRNRAEVENVVGFFVNTQVLRLTTDGDLSFAELLRRVRVTALEAQTNQDLPFDKLVETINPTRNLAHNPLFQVKYNFQNWTYDALHELPGLRLKAVAPGESGAHFDFSLDILDKGSLFGVSVAYATDLFDVATIERLVKGWRSLLRSAIADPTCAVGRLPWIDADERAELQRWSANPAPFPATSVLSLFRLAAAAHADATALRSEAETLNYGALDARSNRLARWLIEQGAARETPIAICMERKAEMVVALLAILKAGAIYVPLDPKTPAERSNKIIADCNPLMILCESGSAQTLQSAWRAPLEALDLSAYSAEPLSIDIEPAQAAYIVYTSGTTGSPKGVVIGHAALANYVQGVLCALRLPPRASMAMVSTIAADLGHTVLFGALCSGGALHLVDEARCFDPDAFADYIERHEIDVLKIVPSHFAALLHASEPKRALPRRTLILGGEATPWSLIETLRRLDPPCRIVNHYGPSETTVGALAGVVEPRGDCRAAPLGRPLPNIRAYVLDEWMEPAPAGVPGEIYLGGAGLARGYWRQAALTAERFVPDPFGGDGGRLYRTGDRARYLLDGVVEFLGRADQQIKIRGYRVEPGEIEQALRAQPDVDNAVVVVHRAESADEEAHAQLIAYCTPRAGATLAIDDIRANLAGSLPDYMLPAAVIELAFLPLTPNGKLDRRALPPPVAAPIRAHTAPRTPLETSIADVWRSVLRRERVSVHDNFFELGGDSILSLQIIARAKKQGIRIKPKDIFEHQTIAELGRVAERIEPAGAANGHVASARARLGGLSPLELDRLPARPDEIADVYPLTPMQQGMLFHSLMDPAGGVHINQRTCTIEGPFDVAAFRGAWNRAIAAHDILRTLFVFEGLDTHLQVVMREAEMPFERHDWRSVPQSEAENRLLEFLRRDRARGFDLRHAPLMRVALIDIAGERRYVVWTLHHLLLDGWSSARLLDEAFADYLAQTQGLPAPAVRSQSFGRYVEWLGGQDRGEAESFWREGLSGLEGPTLLAEQVAPAQRRDGHGSLIRELPSDFGALLRGFAQTQHVTLNTVLQGALALQLARYARTDDVVFGAVVSGRNAPVDGVETMIGMMINALPVRVQVQPTSALGPWLRKIQDHNLALRNYEYSPLSDVQACSGFPHGAPLFDVLLITQNYPVDPGLWDRIGAAGISAFQSYEQTNYPLTIMAVPRGDGLRLRFDYDQRHYDAPLIEAFVDELLEILRALARRPDGRLCEIAAAARREETAEPAAPALRDQSLTRVIEEQVRRTPDAVALMFRDQTYVYAEVNARANRLARRLRAMGVGPDDRVALCVERTPALLIGLLAILKSGGAYVPLEPTHPPARLASMLARSGARVLLTETQWLDALRSDVDRELSVWCFDRDAATLADLEDDDPGDVARPDHLAYCIYTSGSTGEPKGVSISRGSLFEFLSSVQRDIALRADDGMLALTAPSFDISTLELFLPLMSGARIALAERMATSDPRTLLKWVVDCGVTAIQATPSAWRILLQAPEIDALGLRLALCGGEALSDDLAVRLVRSAGEAWNLYGPTETCVWSLRHRLQADDPRPLLGSPFDNTRAHVLDAELNPMPVGVAGELYIGGGGLARGYLGRADFTAERFAPDPFRADGARLYRTGDLARRRADRRIEFIGRVDHQIKIRGFRIEPAEIEACLLAYEGVRAAAIAPRPGPGGWLLAGYVVVEASAPDWPARLETHLRRHLPDHMVPAQIMVLDEMPLTASGKLDRSALPDPERRGRDYLAPRSELEQKLAAIWQEVLCVERVGSTDNFFDLGGHSLLAAQATAKIRNRLGVDMPFDRLFETATLGALADSLAHEEMTPDEIAFMSELLSGFEESGAGER